MTLYLIDKYVWDFWTFRKGDLHHIFYLQAPRTPNDPDLRHACASVGHAISPDLIRWELMPDALHPGQPGSWDDRAIWTGCVLEKDNLYYMFYTSSSYSDGGKTQRIGLATSEDLINWKRHPANPVLEADPQWYEKIGDPGVSEEAWRDPYIVYDIDSNQYNALICAREKNGPSDGRGVIGCARSHNLIEWEVLPPLYATGEFSFMEVPQLITIGDRVYLLFSVGEEWHSLKRRTRLADQSANLCGMYVLSFDHITGEYKMCSEYGLLADEKGTYYAGKIVFNSTGDPSILATRQYDNTGQYLGGLTDPISVGFDTEGKLQIENHSDE